MGRMTLMVVTLSAGLLMAGLWIPLKAVVAQELLALAWARTRAEQRQRTPWPWARPSSGCSSSPSGARPNATPTASGPPWPGRKR